METNYGEQYHYVNQNWMGTMRYFKQVYEECTDYFEYDGEWANKQISIHMGVVLHPEDDEVSDVPLSRCDFSLEEEISSEEFRTLWGNLMGRPHGTRRIDSPLLKIIREKYVN